MLYRSLSESLHRQHLFIKSFGRLGSDTEHISTFTQTHLIYMGFRHRRNTYVSVSSMQKLFGCPSNQEMLLSLTADVYFNQTFGESIQMERFYLLIKSIIRFASRTK